MPKDLKEFAALEEVSARQGGKSVEWKNIASAIISSGQAYTVKEVWELFVEKKVGLFRTKNALDKLVEDGLLDRRYDGRRFWYCLPQADIEKPIPNKGRKKK